MKKYGFTLAEVLIALGIIGVIASLTAPTFIANIRNTTNAARLSATVSTLENAFTTMIAKEDVDSEDLLYDTELWRNINNVNAFAGSMSNYLAMESFRSTGTSNIIGYYGANNGPYGMNTNGSKKNVIFTNEMGGGDNATSTHIWLLKNGATVFINAYSNGESFGGLDVDAIKALGGSLYSIAANVYIDVNGTAAPNIWGRDIFAFELGNNGKLYPEGGKDTSIIKSGTTTRVWDNNGRGNVVGCMDNNIGGDGRGCAARVVEEGYKINY